MLTEGSSSRQSSWTKSSPTASPSAHLQRDIHALQDMLHCKSRICQVTKGDHHAMHHLPADESVQGACNCSIKASGRLKGRTQRKNPSIIETVQRIGINTLKQAPNRSTTNAGIHMGSSASLAWGLSCISHCTCACIVAGWSGLKSIIFCQPYSLARDMK